MTPTGFIRQLRLQALMAAQLRNWRETWDAYVGKTAPRPLVFRDGTVIAPDAKGAPAFLFLEIFANRCYARGVSGGRSGVVVDLGANIGVFTLFWATRHPAVRVHAYEPQPDVCRVLRENVRANGLEPRVSIFEEAVCGAAGSVGLEAPLSSIEARTTMTVAPGQATVPAVTLERVVERAGGTVSLLKMDIEGAEADVLGHAGATLGHIDEIVGEFHAALVPDVVRAIEQGLADTHDVSFDSSPRCGPMFHAVRATR